MAFKDSGKISKEDTYNLGEYEFFILASPDPVDHKTYVTVQCRKGNAIGYDGIEIDGDAEVLGWYVEANEDTADVYINVLNKIDPIDISPIPYPVPSSSGGSWTDYRNRWTYDFQGFSFLYSDGQKFRYINAGPEKNTVTATVTDTNHITGTVSVTTYTNENLEYTYAGKTVYYTAGLIGLTGVGISPTGLPRYDPKEVISEKVAWMLVYGSETEEEEKEYLVARFAIDIDDAGGSGEDSDWEDPEDYDPGEDPIYPDDPDYPDPDDPDYPDPIYPDDPDYPDPDDPDYPGDEDGDGEPDPYHPPYEPPQKTLHLTVTGASAGTHTAEAVPAPNESVADYGCGGFGGYGGGGGAGASTVIVHKFATSKANSKEVTAVARPHGYGSGGGKGGRGGDGIVLVYW